MKILNQISSVKHWHKAKKLISKWLSGNSWAFYEKSDFSDLNRQWKLNRHDPPVNFYRILLSVSDCIKHQKIKAGTGRYRFLGFQKIKKKVVTNSKQRKSRFSGFWPVKSRRWSNLEKIWKLRFFSYISIYDWSYIKNIFSKKNFSRRLP